jgi:hypothetical protein
MQQVALGLQSLCRGCARDDPPPPPPCCTSSALQSCAHRSPRAPPTPQCIHSSPSCDGYIRSCEMWANIELLPHAMSSAATSNQQPFYKTQTLNPWSSTRCIDASSKQVLHVYTTRVRMYSDCNLGIWTPACNDPAPCAAITRNAPARFA